MRVYPIANPLGWCRWKEAEAFLEPARARGDFGSCIEHDEALFVAFEGMEMLGAATAWLSTEGYCEVKLVGGRNCRRWLRQMDEAIGAAARGARATRLIAIGRAEWTRILQRMEWAKCQPVEDHWLFERKL